MFVRRVRLSPTPFHIVVNPSMSSPSSPVLSSRTPRLSRYSWARSCCCSASLCLSSVAITVCVSAAFSRPSLSTSNVLKSSRSGGGGLPVSRCVLRVPSVGVVVTRVSFGRPCFVSCDCSSRLRRNIWQALQCPSRVGILTPPNPPIL